MSRRIVERICKRCVIIGMVVIVLFTMTGCSLAVKDAGEEKSVEKKDRLVGMFITRESVNKWTPDMTDPEENRYYATIDYNDSTDPSDWTIDFEGVKGYAFFHAEFQREGEPFYAQPGKQACSDVSLKYHTTDEMEEITLDGMLYIVSKNGGEEIFHTNAVYQKENGEIYFEPRQGIQTSPDASASMGLKEEIASTGTEEKKGYVGEVNVTFEVLESLPSQIYFRFMNEQLEVIGSENYAPGAVPEELNIVDGAACVVVETVWEDGAVTRELYDKKLDEQVVAETFYHLDDLLLVKKSTTLIWK